MVLFTFIFYSVGSATVACVLKKLDPLSRFHTIPACDERTVRHRAMAYTALDTSYIFVAR